jgi:hypothetical protein
MLINRRGVGFFGGAAGSGEADGHRADLGLVGST